MKKTLVLVVDRDDDFGVKGGVESPVIGVENCSVAVTALGIADPEDSDVNALYAAINIYRDLLNDPNSNVEVALICGNQKVGYRSDAAIIDELEEVLGIVRPDRIILVGDGAEDEYVYPIISSRARIDSVRKVYVKQAPGIEGTLYILSRILSDPGKRRRFLSPIAAIVTAISLIYLLPDLIRMFNGEAGVSVTTPVVGLLIGVMLLAYSYNISVRLQHWQKVLVQRFKSGSISVTFTLISLIIIIAGLIYGYFTFDQTYIYRMTQAAALYIHSVVWFFIIGLIVYIIGDTIDTYIRSNLIKVSNFTSCITLSAIGLIAMGGMDLVLNYLDVGNNMPSVYVIEIAAGLAMAIVGAWLLRYTKQTFLEDRKAEEDAIL